MAIARTSAFMPKPHSDRGAAIFSIFYLCDESAAGRGCRRRFALAARNWTLATYHLSWERQIELAAGRYRRALIAERPEFVALRETMRGARPASWAQSATGA